MQELSCDLKQAAQFEKYLDLAAEEVFSTMMGIHCTPVEECAASEREAVSAVIGLAGSMSGSLVLHCGSQASMRIAEFLTGVAPEKVDATVRDAIGETCNMLAGAWKSFDPAMSSGCLLSTPTVVAGSNYELFSQRAPMRIERSYQFESMHLTITIFCEA
jgi:chemotaxis protein CheX